VTKNLPVPTNRPVSPVPGDYHHLETVVIVNHPIQQARTYLKRNLSNRVDFQLVECSRGERIGTVRAIQVNPAGGGEPVYIEAVNTLPDGTPAGPYTPAGLIERRARVITSHGGPPKALDPRDDIILHVPVKSYLRFLPGVYQGAGNTTERSSPAQATTASQREWGNIAPKEGPVADARNADAMRRFLLLFQHLMTTVVDRVEDIPSITDPLTCDPRFLPWIASWVQFTLDESLPLHQQRELIRRAIRLYRTRATPFGVEEMIRVLTATDVTVQPRTRPQPFVIGGSTLAGGRTISDRYVNHEPLACFLLNENRSETLFFVLELPPREQFAATFSERAPMVLQQITRIVTQEKPAHITFTIQFKEG
jgi:phage tail-like protein